MANDERIWSGENCSWARHISIPVAVLRKLPNKELFLQTLDMIPRS